MTSLSSLQKLGANAVEEPGINPSYTIDGVIIKNVYENMCRSQVKTVYVLF